MAASIKPIKNEIKKIIYLNGKKYNYNKIKFIKNII
jgi:hypothetical protein